MSAEDAASVAEMIRAMACSLQTDNRFSKKERGNILLFLSTKLPAKHGFFFEVESPDGCRSMIETNQPLLPGQGIDLKNYTKRFGFLNQEETVQWKVVKPVTSAEGIFLK